MIVTQPQTYTQTRLVSEGDLPAAGEWILEGLDSSYLEYTLVISGISVTINAVALRMVMSVDGGSTYLGANEYRYGTLQGAGGAASSSMTNIGAFINVIGSISNVDAEYSDVIMRIRNADQAAGRILIEKQALYMDNASAVRVDNGIIVTKNVGPIDTLRFYLTSGAFDAGAYKLYGLQE